MMRLIFLLSFGLLLSVGGEGKASPNILFILVDDLGYGDLGVQGAGDMETPHLDRFFGEGMRWTRFYANCSVCSPTRASALTGRYPDLVGVPGVIRTYARDNWGYLSQKAVTLPSVLKRAGYHTALVGKWHLGLTPENHPQARGFDVFRGFLGDMMDDYYHHRRHGLNYLRNGHEVVESDLHATDLFTEWACEYLQGRTGKESPWFLWLTYNAPHTPIQPPVEYLEKVRKREPGMPENRARLVALIEHLDSGIGRVLDALERSGAKENTLVVFTSDNGGQLSVGANCGALRGGKQDFYEGGIRVPFAVRWPERIPTGSVCEDLGVTMDLFPSFCEVAGAPYHHPIDGLSLASVWGGEKGAGASIGLNEREVVFMRREGNRRYQGQDYYAIRKGPWKLVQNHPFQGYELFDLSRDPQEKEDLIEVEGGVADGLATSLRHHLQRAGAVPWQAPWE